MEENAKAPTAEWLGATRRAISGQLRSAVFVTHTSCDNFTRFDQRIGLTDTESRRSCSHRRNQEAHSRSADLTIESPAVGDRVQVRLLLPAHFEAQPRRRWPVLYLLHGCCDTYLSWSRSTDIEQLTRKRDLLVVMPDGGKVGFYSNWRTGPQWETFHTQELPQLLASQYRANGKAAIAGVSIGGLGALGYAARHPGMYSAAASFSGIVHTRLSSDVSQGYLGLVSSQGTPDPSRCGVIRRPTLQPGSNTTPTTSRLSSRVFRCSYLLAMAIPDHLTRVAPPPTPSSPRSTPRTRSLSNPPPGRRQRHSRPIRRRHAQLGVLATRELHRAWPILTNKLEST